MISEVFTDVFMPRNDRRRSRRRSIDGRGRRRTESGRLTSEVIDAGTALAERATFHVIVGASAGARLAAGNGRVCCPREF
jgi:hypothetical protein